MTEKDFTETELESLLTFRKLIEYHILAKRAFANKTDTCSLSDVLEALSGKSDASMTYTKGETDAAIANYVGRVYRIQGTIDFNELPEPTEDQEGFVYNIRDAFTTNDSFMEGAGKKCPPGTNVVVVVKTPGVEEDLSKGIVGVPAVCKWDVMAGTMDMSPYAKIEDTYNKSQVETKINFKLADYYTKAEIENLLLSRMLNTYKAKGSIRFEDLPEPDSSMSGWVYNMEKAFTTDNRFVEGPGETYRGGTNIVVANVNGTYKYDVLAGIVTDMGDYYTKEQVDVKLESANMHSLKRNTQYAKGDIAYSKDLPSWVILECITAGVTAKENDLSREGIVVKNNAVFTDGTVQWKIKNILSGSGINEREVKLAAGVSCKAGQLLGYRAGGFVLATNTDYSTLVGVVIAQDDGKAGGTVNAISRGSFAVSATDGAQAYVGTDGAIVYAQPTASQAYVKILGHVEGDKLIFEPDSLAIQLA